jgi:hypothetical protein
MDSAEFDFIGPVLESPPAHWLQAPLPDAELRFLSGSLLLSFSDGAAIAPAPALAAALARPGPRGQVLVVSDRKRAPWRLCRCQAAGDTPVWAMQSLADSRRLLLRNLRSAIAPMLWPSILHELHNPLHTISIHAGLIAQWLSRPGGTERIAPGVAVIERAVKELRERQSSVAAVWMAPPDDPEDSQTDQSFGHMLDRSLRLLRSHFAVNEVAILASPLTALERFVVPGGGIPLQLVLNALLVMACKGAAEKALGDPGRSVALAISAAQQPGASPGCVLELRAPLRDSGIAELLHCPAGAAGNGKVLAALTLLLEGGGIIPAALAQDDGIGLVALCPIEATTDSGTAVAGSL